MTRGRHGRDTRRRCALAGWLLLLAGALGMLHVLGRGPLTTPPLTRPGALAAWLDQRSATVVAFSALRLAAMGLAWYLVATTLAGLLARIAGWARWSAVVDALSPVVVRRLLQGAVGLTVAATVTGTQAATWAAPWTAPGSQPASASPVPIMRRLPSGSPSTSGASPRPAAVSPAPPQVGADASAGDGAPRPPPTPSPSPTWVVRPGDNLWSVAEATLARAWGRPPSDAEVDNYWTGLIGANRARLANRDDPDLVFPGQVFELPPTPG